MPHLLRHTTPLFLATFILLALAKSASCAVIAGTAAKATPEQRHRAEIILQENRPRLLLLSQKIRAKVAELRKFEYDSQTEPAVLIRLGRELQALRDALRHEILTLDTRLRRETGLRLRLHNSRGCAGLTRFTPPPDCPPTTPLKNQTVD